MQKIKDISIQYYFYTVYAAVIMIAVLGALMTGFYPILGLPLGVLVVYVGVVDFRKLFYLLLMCIPLSVEFYLPNGFATDLPSEPLIVGLTLLCIYYLFAHLRDIDGAFFKHPIMLVLLLHLAWMLIAALNSQLLFVSVKFFIAKMWYILVFVILTGILIKSEADVRQVFWWVFIPLVFTVVVILFQQNAAGFTLKDSHHAMRPFYRNHVVYAALLSLFLPYTFLARTWYERWSGKWWAVIIGMIIILIGIQLSFTRTAYIALMIAFGAYIIIRMRLMKLAIGLSLVVVIAGLIFLSHNNKYLDYAPNYETTISHYDFGSLIEATYNMEDVSTMERLYRWVAAVQMSKEDLVTGFGPGNFYNFYKGYTVSSFETYVSDNPEKSGIHNYYLMMLTDQGIPGLLIFVLLSIVILIKGEQIYHNSPSPTLRKIIMTALLSIVIIDAFLIINDLIETDKVGSFFFINIAILINMDKLSSSARNSMIPS